MKREWIYLSACTLFCIGMLALRMIYTESFDFRFMAVNMFLAWLPYFFALTLQHMTPGKYFVITPMLYFLWLIFFPNAPYMITDIFHLGEFEGMPLWYDLIMLLSFSWCGLMLGFYSLKKILKRSAVQQGINYPLRTFVLFFLCGTGIYLGRYERWNSWEIITKPGQLITDFMFILQNKAICIQMVTLSFFFALFFTMIFVALFRHESAISEDRN